MEVARVNYNGGQPVRVAKDKLQSKQKRYYFKDAFRLNRGEVFVSPLDLNIKRGKVEKPYKPMIRFGTPVYDQAGEKQGIVLLNYLGNNLLALIQDVGSVARGQTMSLNADGYWLQHPDATKAWGFMFEEKADLSLAAQSPEIWAQMHSNAAGDELLVAVGKRMGTSCRDSDTVARMGGDEFAVLLTEVSDAEGAQALTEKFWPGSQSRFFSNGERPKLAQASASASASACFQLMEPRWISC